MHVEVGDQAEPLDQVLERRLDARLVEDRRSQVGDEPAQRGDPVGQLLDRLTEDPPDVGRTFRPVDWGALRTPT